MTHGDGGGSRRSRKRPLSEEDRRLWDHVVRSVAPNVRKKQRVLDGPGYQPPDEAGRNSETTAELHTRLESGAGRIPSPKSQVATPPPAAKAEPRGPHRHVPPPIADFDRKAARRIRSGRTDIEARIDLHGMRQDEAHMTLRGFLNGCHARGLRWVLVITGKGRSLRLDGGEADSGPARRRGADRRDFPSWQEDERGVLKRVVPRWLAEPELRAIVVSYTTAAPNHGGEGALYIQLRARR